MILQRHDLVDVAADAWSTATATLDLPPVAAACVEHWVRHGRPAMIRRRLAGETADAVPLAIQLPNAAGRLRLALTVPTSAITPRAPVGLREAASSAPAAWGDVVATLLSAGERFGVPRVYGGLLWHHLTGEAVLRPGSDLDLLWHPDPQHRAALVERLAAVRGDVVVDGEIVLEDGAGVSWRELHAGTATVAVKTIDGVALRARRAILSERVPC